jgi:hypothetical protein
MAKPVGDSRVECTEQNLLLKFPLPNYHPLILKHLHHNLIDRYEGHRGLIYPYWVISTAMGAIWGYTLRSTSPAAAGLHSHSGLFDDVHDH